MPDSLCFGDIGGPQVLIVKTSALGDIVQTFPVVSYLLARHHDAHVDWVVEGPYAELLRAHPHVKRVLTIESKRWRKRLFLPDTYARIREFRHELQKRRYDAVFDLQGNMKSGLVTSQARACDKVGFARGQVPETPNLFFTNRQFTVPDGASRREDYLALVKNYYEDTQPVQLKGVFLRLDAEQKEQLRRIRVPEKGPCFLVSPGSAWRNKSLPLPVLERVLIEIQRRCVCSFLICWGSEEERRAAESLSQNVPYASCLPKLPLPVLQNLMTQMDLVLSMDSLPLHLAATTDTPTFGFFGPSLAAKYAPSGKQHGVFQGSCPYGRHFDARCPILRTCSTGACLREQLPQAILESFFSWWPSVAKMPVKG